MLLMKLRAGLVNFFFRTKLKGVVEVDERYIGGKEEGKRGRGASGKALVVEAYGYGHDIEAVRDVLLTDRHRCAIIENWAARLGKRYEKFWKNFWKKYLTKRKLIRILLEKENLESCFLQQCSCFSFLLKKLQNRDV